MDFYIGQTFEGKYPPTAAMWCNNYNSNPQKDFTVSIEMVEGVYTITGTPVIKDITILARDLSMPKSTFVNMVEEFTAAMAAVNPTVQPITFETIWQWCMSNPTILKLFITEDVVYRNDPMLDSTTGQFAPEFIQYLDMMFVYQNEIMQEITLAKQENRAINLDAFIGG